MKRINEWLAQYLGNKLSSMSFFWFCVLLDLVELPPLFKAHSVVAWCTYVSQTVIQLLALPLLGAQNRLQNKLHEETHRKLDAQEFSHEQLHSKLEKLSKQIKEKL
jgi:hypothetical protein